MELENGKDKAGRTEFLGKIEMLLRGRSKEKSRNRVRQHENGLGALKEKARLCLRKRAHVEFSG